MYKKNVIEDVGVRIKVGKRQWGNLKTSRSHQQSAFELWLFDIRSQKKNGHTPYRKKKEASHKTEFHTTTLMRKQII